MTTKQDALLQTVEERKAFVLRFIETYGRIWPLGERDVQTIFEGNYIDRVEFEKIINSPEELVHQIHQYLAQSHLAEGFKVFLKRVRAALLAHPVADQPEDSYNRKLRQKLEQEWCQLQGIKTSTRPDGCCHKTVTKRCDDCPYKE